MEQELYTWTPRPGFGVAGDIVRSIGPVSLPRGEYLLIGGCWWVRHRWLSGWLRLGESRKVSYAGPPGFKYDMVPLWEAAKEVGFDPYPGDWPLSVTVAHTLWPL